MFFKSFKIKKKEKKPNKFGTKLGNTDNILT